MVLKYLLTFLHSSIRSKSRVNAPLTVLSHCAATPLGVNNTRKRFTSAVGVKRPGPARGRKEHVLLQELGEDGSIFMLPIWVDRESNSYIYKHRAAAGHTDILATVRKGGRKYFPVWGKVQC